MSKPTPTADSRPGRTAVAAPMPLRLLVAVLLLAGLAACGGGLLGGSGDTGPYDRPATDRITGEVERVEEYANEIDLWTAERRIVTVEFADDTPVYYRGERFDPAALERGDVVTVQVERGPAGGWLAERIDVDQARQDRVGDGGTADDPWEEEDPRGDDPWDPDADRRTVEGEIRSVDLDARRLEVATEHGRHTVTFGRATPVYWRGEEHEVAGLEPGDVIRAEVDTTREPWRVLDFITVVEARQERSGVGDDPWDDDPWSAPGTDPDEDEEEGERFAGSVQQVDPRRGEFVLDTERYGLRTVVMPYNASRDDRTAFERLRRGDSVRIEGRRVDRERIELIRFGW